MIKQNKGRLLKDLPGSVDLTGPWLVSKKYDGFYTQIKYKGGEVSFFTSGGKEFYLPGVAEDIKSSGIDDFHIECEYIHGCEGKLGDRGRSARLTTYRTNFSKGIASTIGDGKFILLDMLNSKDDFFDRVQELLEVEEISQYFEIPYQIELSFSEAQDKVREWVADGWEGGMLKHINHIYKPGKRTNDIIKLKSRKEAVLECIGVKGGTGKYVNMIGSLVLRDEMGREVDVGSGLTDAERGQRPRYFVGKMIEIDYERIDSTYIQPTYKRIQK